MTTGVEKNIAQLLGWGTILGTAVTLAGLLLNSQPTLLAGIATFILLPITRLVLMLFAFARDHDLALAMITLLVLAIIGVSVFLSFHDYKAHVPKASFQNRSAEG